MDEKYKTNKRMKERRMKNEIKDNKSLMAIPEQL